ncbi:carbohydrate ABC transporter permease [Paenibacillus koleovorans]|uniref:carbohydrate ABC transporter permease n=1 Tax=Paenibacillus koleovorans TaxID=121608 RepID=UPI000FDC1874|nr:carbohydrate ABC transporter permease [Paenibacillus koleovorans]
MRVRKSASENMGDVFIYLSMWFVLVITLYPFIYIVSLSVSEPTYVIQQLVWLWPKGFSLNAYKMVFDNPDVWTSYYNTIYYTVVGTAINISFTILGAYPLARSTFFARKQIMVFIVITMFFSGGLIPMFLLIQNLNLYNTRWAILLPSAVSAFLLIVTRTFFQSISESLHESAKLDGAGEFTILTRIVIPLSTPIIAVLALFYAVGHWNSYFAAMIYLTDAKLQPLSLYLVKVLVQNSDTMMEEMSHSDRSLYSLQIKYALIIVSILPILMIYPFLQKYFVKGVMLGSLKE